MIRLRMNSTLGYTDLEINPAKKLCGDIFPDKTSQVWKLPDEIVNQLKNYTIYIENLEIYWKFENEAELIHVCQLAQLIYEITKNKLKIVLNIPYLPYGRQDKEISNTSCFALTTFWFIINHFFIEFKTLDAHSNVLIDRANHDQFKFINESPNQYIEKVIDQCDPDFICFPDKGASQRGYDTNGLDYFSLDKKRDPLTGKILGIKSVLPLNLKGKKILILDDICDGGWTFTEAAKVLYEMGAEEVYLYVTHGIFSKGTQVLKDAGIKRIFTYEGEIK